MWNCSKCTESNEDNFDACWNCGHSKSGEADQDFQHADDISIKTLESPNRSLDAVQQERNRRSKRHWNFRRFCLQFARIVSLLSCIVVVFGFLLSVPSMRNAMSVFLYFLASVCSILYSVAMFFVFSHVLNSK